jgi:anthranilate 1,2-dioxygenase large subunit
VKDPYHASLLHLFHTTFNILRIGMAARCIADANHGLHSIIYVSKTQDANSEGYKSEKIRSFKEGFTLEETSLLDMRAEYAELTTNHIQPIFPQLVIQQIHNTLVARQLLPKGPDHFELVFHFFGYTDDNAEMRKLRIKQANLVGPAGYISMEDTEATELVQQGVVRDPDATSIIDMARDAPEQSDTLITEKLIRSFWSGYQRLMALDSADAAEG